MNRQSQEEPLLRLVYHWRYIHNFFHPAHLHTAKMSIHGLLSL